MRKARDERSKQMEKEKVAVGAGAANGGFANNGGNSVADGMTLDTSALENDIASNKSNGRSNGTFNKPNKGKKKKNKKKGKKR